MKNAAYYRNKAFESSKEEIELLQKRIQVAAESGELAVRQNFLSPTMYALLQDNGFSIKNAYSKKDTMTEEFIISW